jgi:hypothetical protein
MQIPLNLESVKSLSISWKSGKGKKYVIFYAVLNVKKIC